MGISSIRYSTSKKRSSLINVELHLDKILSEKDYIFVFRQIALSRMRNIRGK